MESISNLEQSIARFVLGELSPQEEADVRSRLTQDPAASRLEAQMRETIGALRAWQGSHATMPRPALPIAGSRWMRWIGPAVGVAAAAAVVALIAAWQAKQASLGPDLSHELAALMADQPRASEGLWTYEASVRKHALGTRSIAGPVVRAPESTRHAPPGAPHDLAAFVQQFDFTFRVPETLPGDWRLIRAVPLGKDRIVLSYGAASQAAKVSLSASAGPETAPAAVEVRGQWFVVARCGGVLVAFEREAFPEKQWSEIVPGFAIEGRSP